MRGRVIERSESLTRENSIHVEGETPWGVRFRKWIPQSIAQRAVLDVTTDDELPDFISKAVA